MNTSLFRLPHWRDLANAFIPSEELVELPRNDIKSKASNASSFESNHPK